MNRWALLLILAAGLTAWWVLGDRNSWRYKMTVGVQTPEGVRLGSAVREVRYQSGGGWFLFGESRPQWRVQGQAVVVDLPNGKSLYVLLRSEGPLDVSYGARIADRVLGNGGRVKRWPGPVELYPSVPAESLGGAFTSTASLMPMLVTFGNPRNPESVELVDPTNMEAKIGAGYSLKRVTIDIVAQPITTGLDEHLPWLGAYPEPSLKPNHGPHDWSLAAKLKHGDFVRR